MPGRRSLAAFAVASTAVLADRGDDGALALRRELARLEGQRTVGPGHGTPYADGFGHEGLLSRRACRLAALERPAGSQSATP